WDEGYRFGVNDERMSEANIGIAGMGMKVEPARNNPYRTTPPQRTEQCNYPDCKCPTENPCLKGLAQPEQEPVAMVESVATVVSESGNKEVTMSWWHEPALPVGTKLYTHPSQNVIDKSAAKRIATTLGWEPKRGWVDVPDEEIKILWIQYRAAMPRYLCFAKALLARSKEKNNA
ncbi:hypothetical protein EBT25_19165, partial [bacterium]|nr:hypothetical protein [bacterium]